MRQQKSRIISIAIGLIILLLGLVMITIYWGENRPISVDELWKREFEHGNLEGKTVTVRGDIIFEPLSDFRFNNLYLADKETPEEFRILVHGFWFGLRIGGISCTVYNDEGMVTCEPFDPSQATTFEFKGTI